jgi:hypothetical protein
MKSLFGALGATASFIAAVLASPLAAHAQDVVTLEQIQMQELAVTSATLNVIDWKVGDNQDYKVTLGFGMQGKMHKEVVREEGNAVWIKQYLSLQSTEDNTEILIDRESGKILKLIRNGKEEKIPDGKLEIISTNNEVIEVPAGKFKAIHVVGKSKDIKKFEAWISPREIAMDGQAKVIVDQGMMTVTMELTKFVKNK